MFASIGPKSLTATTSIFLMSCQAALLSVNLPILPKPLIAILYFITSILYLLNIELLYIFKQYTYLS